MAKALRKQCDLKSEVDLNELLHTSGLTNPSVLVDAETGDLHVTAKAVGFDRKRIWLDGDWDAMIDQTGRISIRHLYARLGPDLDVVTQRSLVFQDLKCEEGAFDTVDDVRLIGWKQGLFLVGSCLQSDTGRRNGAWKRLGPTRTRMFLAPFSPGIGDDKTISVEQVSILPAFFNDAIVDKNWITHEHNRDDLLLCVDINRGIWIKLNEFPKAAVKMPAHGLVWRGGWSGNSNLVDVSGVHIGLVHRKSDCSPCVYEHMFVMCDRHFAVVRRSEPFSFEEQAVEFSTGLAFDRRNEDIIISYGVWDRDAKLIRIGLPELSRLCSLPVLDPTVLYGVACDAYGFYRDNPALVSMAHDRLTVSYHKARLELLNAGADDAQRFGSIAYWLKDEKVQNFGDFLSEYFANRLFRSVDRTTYNVHVIGSVIADYWVNSAIRQVAHGGGEPSLVAVFWGCGLREPLGPALRGLSRQSQDRVSIRAVRGPLTALELGLTPDFPQGDPGLLMPFLYEPGTSAEYRGRSIVVPHFQDSRPDADLRSRTGADLVLRPNIPNALAEIERFVDRLCSSRFVLTGSLHAAIVAAAYGIPFAFWDSGNIDMPFKWRDFAASINAPCVFQPDVGQGELHYAREIAPQLRIPNLLPLLLASPFEVRSDVISRVMEQEARISPSDC